MSFALPSTAVAQGAVFSTELLYAAGSAAPCGNGTQAITTVAARGARVSLLPAPVTAFARDRLGSPVVAAGYQSDARRSWQFVASGAVGHSSPACAIRSSESRALLGIARRIGGGGVTLTVGAPSLSSLDPSRDRAGVTLGAWRSMGRTKLSLELRRHGGSTSGWRYTTVFVPGGGLPGGLPGGDTLTSRPDTLPGTNRLDSAATEADWRALDARTRAALSFGPLLLDFTAGATRAGGTGAFGAAVDSTRGGSRNTIRLWGRADARLAVGSSMQVIGALVALPAQPGVRTVPGPVFTFGVGLTGLPRIGRARPAAIPAGGAAAAGAPAFEVARIDSMARLRLRIPAAALVELSSELTGWRAVAMTREGGDWWSLSLPAEPGVYRVNIRVDGGAWTPPPGVPSVRDEFGGSVGMVPIR